MKGKKTAIVTGAGRGIGRVVARGLAQDGFRLALIARTAPELNELKEEILRDVPGTDAGEIIIVAADVVDPKTAPAVVEQVMSDFGQIDLLFNNAGVYARGTLDVSPETVEKMLAVNLMAPLRFIQEVAPIMKDQDSGMIVNLASLAGKLGGKDCGGYSASKFGLVGLGESLFRILSLHNVKVVSICPGYVHTEMAVHAGSPFPPEAMIQPEDILSTIRWLLSMSPEAYVKEVVIECRGAIKR